MEILEINLVPKNAKFFCNFCHFNCNKQSNWIKHINTKKHINGVNGNNLDKKNAKLICVYCGKNYATNSGLWKHNNICSKVNQTTNIVSLNNEINNETNSDSSDEKKIKNTEALINYLMKENTEFKQLMIEQNKQFMELAKQNNIQIIELAKNAGNNTTNNTTNNSFNLNFFLNETCKNALNIMDFVNQLPIGINDLEETGRLGFADGISKIFINGLKDIDITYRPVHCSDPKRETLYIKNDNQWNKEGEDRLILTKAIRHIVNKNINQISEWTKKHPDYNNSESKDNDKYLRIICESIPGSTQEESNKNYNKIIKNIVKNVVINK